MNLLIVLVSCYLKYLVKGNLDYLDLVFCILALQLVLTVTLAVMMKLLLQTCSLRKPISQAIRLVVVGEMCSLDVFKSNQF